MKENLYSNSKLVLRREPGKKDPQSAVIYLKICYWQNGQAVKEEPDGAGINNKSVFVII